MVLDVIVHVPVEKLHESRNSELPDFRVEMEMPRARMSISKIVQELKQIHLFKSAMTLMI